MTKNTVKTLIIGLIGFIILVMGIYLLNNRNVYEKEKTPLGIGGQYTNEVFYSWKKPLNIRAIEIFDEAINDNYTLDNDGKFVITLYELQTKYGKDFSMYNTDTISCDLQNSTITVKKIEEDGIEKIVDLSCTNSEEQEESLEEQQ